MAKPSLFTCLKWLRTVAAVQRRSAALGIHVLDAETMVLGWLDAMWETANASDGKPRIGSPANVEVAARWRRDPGVVFEILCEERWIDEVHPTADEMQHGDADGEYPVPVPLEGSGCWAIHDYYDHCPKYVRDRWQKRSARSRGNGKPEERPAPPKAPPAAAGAGGEPEAAAPKKEPSSRVLFTLPCAPHPRTRETEWPVTAEFVAEMAPCYPGVPVETELRKLRGRLVAGEAEKASYVGMPRRVTNWLSKAEQMSRQTSGGASAPRTYSSRQPPPAPTATPGSSPTTQLDRAVIDARARLFRMAKDGRLSETDRDAGYDRLAKATTAAQVTAIVQELTDAAP